MMKLTLVVLAHLASACLLLVQIFYILHWEDIEFLLEMAEMGL